MIGPGDPRHGTRNGYNNHGCRCDLCREASTVEHRVRQGRLPRAERAALLQRHGTKSRYRKGCRCRECSAANATANRVRQGRYRVRTGKVRRSKYSDG